MDGELCPVEPRAEHPHVRLAGRRNFIGLVKAGFVHASTGGGPVTLGPAGELTGWPVLIFCVTLLVVLMRGISAPAIEPLLGVVCFFVTFFLIGVWHGRTSEYIVFGILQGGGVAINKIWQLWLTRVLGRKAYKDLARNAAYIAFARGLTFSWFAFTMFWFWANWKQIGAIFSAIPVGAWFAVWLLMGFFKTIPQELEDAALIDGCSRLGALVRIVFPISLPGILTVVIFTFSLVVNEFLYAITFISSSTNRTLTVGVPTDLIRGDLFNWPGIMAAFRVHAMPAAVTKCRSAKATRPLRRRGTE